MRARIVRDGEGLFYGVYIICPSKQCSGHLIPVHPAYLPKDETESPRATHHPDGKPKPHWTWNGSLERPTFSPSIRVAYRIEGEDESVCHSQVTDGRIKFYEDSTHELAGQTVDLPEVV